MKKIFTALFSFILYSALFTLLPAAESIDWDATSLIIDGKRVVPVMGEVHFSRIPADEWRQEVKKMKDGGITIIATYVFWNHHEDIEGVWDWSGQRDLRQFIKICQEYDLPVVLRVGPFCHGEARNGGIPDYMFDKGCRMRSEDPIFLSAVDRLYRQIFNQIQGLQFKDGGPIIAAQFDNEYRGHGSYLMALKSIAHDIGFDLPFYTRTGWPELRTPLPYGEMIPLFGDYADGFWDRTTGETDGNYYKAFNFRAHRASENIATDQINKDELDVKEERGYPYFTCELGGGMTTAYHRRPYMYPEDAYAMAMVKLGSGSNLLGYYMYHGGSNPTSRSKYLNEDQDTPATNYNDMPHISYEFQAPLGEFGQVNPHYYLLRPLHMFMHDYAEQLAPMQPFFPAEQERPKGDDSSLRWAYRSDGKSAVVFINNYERLQHLTDKDSVQFNVCGTTFPSYPITIPAGTICAFPVNIDGIDYATAQLVAKRDGNIYLMQIEGVPTELSVDGVVINDAKCSESPIYKNIYLISPDQAARLFLEDRLPVTANLARTDVPFSKVQEAGDPRNIPLGANKVAKQPTDTDFLNAAIYEIHVPEDRQGALLDIDYIGDCARIYAGGRLVADNFYNGRNFQYALWRLDPSVTTLRLYILPMQPDAPIYYSSEAEIYPGEQVKSVSIIK